MVTLTSQGYGAATTGGGSAAAVSQMDHLVTRAYDRQAYFQYRPDAIYNMLADVKPGITTSPGSSVRFTFWQDLDAATTPLKEIEDVDAVGMENTIVDVTPFEYGNAVMTSLKLREDEFLLNFEPDIANTLSYNITHTLESLASMAWNVAGGSANVPTRQTRYPNRTAACLLYTSPSPRDS